MQEDNQIEHMIRNTIMELCAVLYNRGYKQVPIGSMMRLLGVNPERASLHDHEWFNLDDEFATLYSHYESLQQSMTGVPPDATLH
jgi:hypothetical protein